MSSPNSTRITNETTIEILKNYNRFYRDNHDFPQVVIRWDDALNSLESYLNKCNNSFYEKITHSIDRSTQQKFPLDILKLIVNYTKIPVSIPILKKQSSYLLPEPEEMTMGIMSFSDSDWGMVILVRLSVKIDKTKWKIKSNSADGRYVSTMFFAPGGFHGGCASVSDEKMINMLYGMHSVRGFDHGYGPCSECILLGDSHSTITHKFIDMIFNSPVNPDSPVYIAHSFTPIPKTYAEVVQNI